MNASRVMLPVVPVELERVESALKELRCRPGDPASAAGGHQPITRACMSNLIVYCDSAEQADTMPHEFAAIARRHPARILLLVGGSEDQEAEIESGVSVNLVQTVGGPQISSEQIRISARESAIARLPSAARALLIGDLPTALWWSSTHPPSSKGTLFEELADMAETILYDSRGWPDPRRGMIDTADWVLAPDNDKRITDLAWMRLRWSRKLLAETLSPNLQPGALARIRSVEIEHGPHALPMVWLFVGWLAHCLRWSPTGGTIRSMHEHDLQFERLGDGGEPAPGSHPPEVFFHIRRDDEGPPLMRHVRIQCHPGPDGVPLQADFEALEQDRLAIRIEDGLATESIVSVHDDPRAAMLALQLASRSDQPLFRDVLDLGRNMAQQLRR